MEAAVSTRRCRCGVLISEQQGDACAPCLALEELEREQDEDKTRVEFVITTMGDDMESRISDPTIDWSEE
jgi:hypothetical protein